MASFTDNTQILTNFNPYVSQAPVIEAMSRVGIEKQMAYEQGVQRIQSQVDHIAGLDVVRDADRQYLQSKLHTLKGELNKVAVGDFSNFQLVNSVGGMINQISKDKYVRNAVSNTAKYRKELEFGESLRKQGKLSPNREYDFDKSVNEWMSNPDLNASFTGRYKEHIDVNKKVIDVIQKLNPNVNIQDIPYVINPNGTINTKLIASAMQRQGVKEVSEGQIKTAINASLDANDIDEIYSQGRYNYRNIDPASLKELVTQNYRTNRSLYQNKINDVKKQILTATSVDEQVDLNNQLKYYQSLLGDAKVPGLLQAEYHNSIASINSNPDEARASVYMRNWLDQLSNGFSYREVKNEIVDNPMREDYWKAKNYEFAVEKERFDQTAKLKDLELKERQLLLQESEKADKDAAYKPYFKASGDPSSSSLSSLQNYYAYNDSLSGQNNSILTDLAERSSSVDTTLTPNDIKVRVEEYKSGKYTPSNIDEKAQFDQYIRNSSILENQKALLNKFDKQAREKINKEKGISTAPIDEQLQDKQNLVIGSQVFSPKEIYDYLQKEKSKIQGGPTAAEKVTIDESKLSEKEKSLKKALERRYKVVGYGDAPSSGNPEIDNYLNDVTRIVRQNAQVQSDVNKYIIDKMANITGSFATEQAAVKFKDTPEKEGFLSDLANEMTADIYTKVGGERYTPEEALSLVKKETLDDVAISFKRAGDSYFVELINKNDPSEIQSIPVSRDFVIRNQVLGKDYLNQNIDLSQVMLRNNKSTNIFKDYDHAYYPTGYFGGYDSNQNRTVTLPVAADLEQTSAGPTPVFKLKTINGTIQVNLPYPIDPNEFESTYLPSLNNDKIVKLFKTRYPNIEQLIAQ